MEIRLRNDLSEIARATEALHASAEAQGLDEAERFQLDLCLDELLSNIIAYAYNDAGQHEIRLTVTREDGMLCLVLEDEGIAFNPLEQAAAPDLEADLSSRAVGGLGLHLVRSFMDSMHYRRTQGGNRLELQKRLG